MPNIFQTPEWAKFKCQTGYEKYYEIDGLFVLQKKLPLSRTMLYSPMLSEAQVESGPSRLEDEAEAEKLKVESLVEKIKNITKENKAIFYRAEFDCLETDELINQLTNNKFTKSFEEMQPEHTLILNIAKSDEDILTQMKPKGRYNIKVAEKHGVAVKKTRDVTDFYRLYEQTAKRQRITYRNREYFQKLLDNLEPKGYCELFVACGEDGTVLASAIISFYKSHATYLFGASSDEMRGAMAPYGLHWQIISEAKRRGCTEYDFFGIAPDDNPKHPWAGISRFKKQFGGQEIHLMGSWDLVMRPMEYKVFKLAEKIRRH
jgi:lipid II:glycine glycyltransferase (peptidoglycan interpeptide bridge formation enzyme)